MPPRYAYWTILVDGQPTAFRAAEPDELLPTLKRLQVKHPGADMRWFERGRLWASRDEAKQMLADGYTVAADGSLVAPDQAEKRTRSWRPGGEHRDPREKYQLAKKAKWQKFKAQVRARPGHGRPRADDSDTPTGPPPRDDAPPQTDWRGRPKAATAPATTPGWRDRPKPAWRDTPSGGGGGGGVRPAGKPRPDVRGPKPEWTSRHDSGAAKAPWRDRPKPAWSNRDSKPGVDGRGPSARGPKAEWRDRPTAPRGPKPEGRDRPKPEGRDRDAKPEWLGRAPSAKGTKPEGRDRPAGPRGPKPEWRDHAPKPAWRDRDAKPDGPGRSPSARAKKPEWRDRPQAPRGPKPEWRDRGPSADRTGPRPERKDPRPDGGVSKTDRKDHPKKSWGPGPKGAPRPLGGGARFPKGAPRGNAPPRRKKD